MANLRDTVINVILWELWRSADFENDLEESLPEIYKKLKSYQLGELSGSELTVLNFYHSYWIKVKNKITTLTFPKYFAEKMGFDFDELLNR